MSHAACQFPNFLNRFFSSKISPEIPTILKKADQYHLGYSSFFDKANTSEMSLYYSKLPEDLKSQLGHAGPQVFRQDGLNFISNFTQFYRSHQKEIDHLGGFDPYFKKIAPDYLALTSDQKQAIEETINWEIRKQKINFIWKDTRISIPHNHETVKIGTREFPILSQNGHSISIRVKVSDLDHSHENPVSMEHVAQLARAGVSKTKRFEVAVGFDGKLYIEDGNHRIHLLQPHDDVVAVLSNPPKTVQFDAFFSLIGEKGLSLDQKLMFIEGKAKLEDFISPKIRSKIIYWNELKKQVSDNF